MGGSIAVRPWGHVPSWEPEETGPEGEKQGPARLWIPKPCPEVWRCPPALCCLLGAPQGRAWSPN